MTKNKHKYYKIWNEHHPDDPITIGDGYHIHHIDGDHNNNDPDNLQKMKAFDHLSFHNKGRLMNKEWREKISKANKGENNSFYGKKHTLNTIKIISKKVKDNCPRRKLSRKTIIWIRNILGSEEYKEAKSKKLINQTKLAELFGVKPRTISKIKFGYRKE
ncbi:MAG: NUMOD3 domain-containing DNA-binding protein [Candidatus Thorarchaeota archaeon]